jgi:ABC-type dipeptide/oligopeptide/nickel transport system permease component
MALVAAFSSLISFTPSMMAFKSLSCRPGECPCLRIPTITVLGVNIGWLIGNTLVIEKVFAIPGLGALMIDSVLARDFPVVQALALIFGLLVVLVSLSADLVRAALDPRISLR